MKILIIINDAPYGTEKAYNALRIAMNIQKESPETEVSIFLMADAVGCALPNQTTPSGYYNIQIMMKSVIRKGAVVRACGTCMDARGFAEIKLIDGVERSNMKELTELILKADKVINY
ncbi:MAG: DsrE family protein [Melioribacteraceae bacterium]|nr:DsrE family protein [Melioribacteraceae bacterium]MCF8356472.1 DsrE family protein [Melioribacteraceae bacterium]MCF8393384.1 DsrE family protein [Melioribacteraceae bacterium]MCF8418949.1 DsrE family protein [Melioribacteraceae bacterium]